MRFNFMVAKSCFATLAIVESALDSALAESKKSMLHALRVTLTLACFVVHKIGFKGGQKCPAADFMLEAE